jgi:hypothetical protein
MQFGELAEHTEIGFLSSLPFCDKLKRFVHFQSDGIICHWPPAK